MRLARASAVERLEADGNDEYLAATAQLHHPDLAGGTALELVDPMFTSATISSRRRWRARHWRWRQAAGQ